MTLGELWPDTHLPVIGMVHLAALPGSPRNALSLPAIKDLALHDAEALISGGVQGLMLENFGDTPFLPGSVSAATIAQMTCLLTEIKRHFLVPCGVNVLRNDGIAALATAAAAGGEFIRVNVLTGARVTDQGIIQGIAHDLLRERRRLQADSIQIWADVNVKHSAPLAPRPLQDEVADLVHRAHADAVIVTGSSTGAVVAESELEETIAAAEGTPVIIGSGVSAETIRGYMGRASAVIVGSSLKHDGKASNPVDRTRVEQLIRALS